MRYVTRGQWGAREPDYRVPLPHPVREAYIHHGGGGSRNDDPFVVVPSWQEQHMDIKEWSDIAYQEIVSGADEYDGWVFEGRGFGIQSGATGPPQDSRSLSICFIGNYEHDVPSPASLESAAQRLAYCVKVGRLTPDFTLYGDKDVNATACPGRNLYVKLSSIRRRVDEIVAGPEPTPIDPDPPTDPEDDDMRWLYYQDESNGTELVVTSSGRVRLFGPGALRELRVAEVIPPTPVKVSHEVAQQFLVGGK